MFVAETGGFNLVNGCPTPSPAAAAANGIRLMYPPSVRSEDGDRGGLRLPGSFTDCFLARCWWAQIAVDASAVFSAVSVTAGIFISQMRILGATPVIQAWEPATCCATTSEYRVRSGLEEGPCY